MDAVTIVRNFDFRDERKELCSVREELGDFSCFFSGWVLVIWIGTEKKEIIS